MVADGTFGLEKRGSVCSTGGDDCGGSDGRGRYDPDVGGDYDCSLALIFDFKLEASNLRVNLRMAAV